MTFRLNPRSSSQPDNIAPDLILMNSSLTPNSSLQKQSSHYLIYQFTFIHSDVVTDTFIHEFETKFSKIFIVSYFSSFLFKCNINVPHAFRRLMFKHCRAWMPSFSWKNLIEKSCVGKKIVEQSISFTTSFRTNISVFFFEREARKILRKLPFHFNSEWWTVLNGVRNFCIELLTSIR